MPSISITEEEYDVLFSAAHRAMGDGHKDEADKLDKICRKANAALSNGITYSGLEAHRKRLSWKDVDSVFIGIKEGKTNE